MAVAVVVLVGFIASAAPAAAHASLIATTPRPDEVIQAPPSEVLVRFDEAVSIELGAGIEVFDPDGRPVHALRADLREGSTVVAVGVDAASTGTYTVAWRVVSGDAHVLSGSFVFHVGVETGAARIEGDNDHAVVGWVGRWLGALAVTLLAGAAAFAVLAERGDAATGMRWWLVAVALVGLVAAVVRMGAQVAATSGRSLSGSFALFDDAVDATRIGRLDAFRVVAMVLALVAVRWWPRRVSIVSLASVIGGVMVVNALAGHGWTADRRAVGIVSSVVHQGAVAVWVGGVAALGWTWYTGGDVRGVGRRFTAAAGWALGAVVVSGLASGTGQVEGFADVWSTRYGRLLLAKAALTGVMVLLGSRVRRWLLGPAETSGRSARASLHAEVAVAVMVIALAAGLVGTTPARQAAAAGPFSVTVDDADGLVNVTVDPARAGPNVIHLYFLDGEGFARRVDAVEVAVVSGDLPARRVEVIPITSGHFTASSVSLPFAGAWTLTVTSVTRGEPTETIIEVPVS